jgi:hypothetical protein
MSLGESFPDALKKQFSESNLVAGAIIRAWVDNTTPPKIKRFIVIGVSQDKVLLGVVYINSEINPHVFPSQELRDLHLKLAVETRDYLTHDSFVDCSRIFQLDRGSISKLLHHDPACHLGTIGKEDLSQIRKIIRGSRTVSVRVKKMFGLL